jgi:AmpD protein
MPLETRLATRFEMQLDQSGWLQTGPGVTLKPSPNFNERSSADDISLLVIHNISLPPGQFGTPYVCDLFLNQLDLKADPWFSCLEGLKVSAHFLIDRNGHITQFVSCDARAWHAGVSSFNGREQCNDFSIGIELEGTDTVAYTDAQYASLQALTHTLTERYRLRSVRGHEHIAPNRKTDPGASFDWVRFNQAVNLPGLDWPAVG